MRRLSWLLLAFQVTTAAMARPSEDWRHWTEKDCARIFGRYSQRTILVSFGFGLWSTAGPTETRFVLLTPDVYRAAIRLTQIRNRLSDDEEVAELRRQVPGETESLSIWVGMDTPRGLEAFHPAIVRVDPGACSLRDPKVRERFLRPTDPHKVPELVGEALLRWGNLGWSTVISFPREADFWRTLEGKEFELEYHYNTIDRAGRVKFKRKLIEQLQD